MSEVLNRLRGSRKNPSVLKIKVLKIFGEDPDVFVFIFEGVDDVPVYEEWLRRVGKCPRFEPVPGAGKQQLLAYHEMLKSSGDPLLGRILFFVDRDFDPPMGELNQVYELDAYSIENFLCTDEVLDSILRDEFRCAGEIAERARIKAAFSEVRSRFVSHCEPVNFALFAAQRLSLVVERKPERISDISTITITEARVAYGNVKDIVRVAGWSTDYLRGLEAEFEKLPMALKQRGKYLVDMFRRWLRLLAEDFKSQRSLMFGDRGDRLAGDPSALPLRRFASVSEIPGGLADFVGKFFVA